MELEAIVGLSQLIGTGTLALLGKSFLPKYFEQKASNLATKEDIEDITKITESVKQEFNEKMQIFSTQHTFRHSFSYERYAKLYSQLYGYILQSEYAREFFEVDTIFPNKEDAPFIQIATRVTTTKNNNGTVVSEERVMETELAEHSKIKMCQIIIENGGYASQKLLKLAFSYKVAHSFYGVENKNHELNEKADDEELRLIREIVICIVKEYNELRQFLEMDFCQEELKKGQVNLGNAVIAP